MSDSPVVLVFDIDGTLLDSVEAHQSALRAAFRTLGVELGDRALSDFPHHTDSAIFDDLCIERSRGGRATSEQLEQLDSVLGREYRRRTRASPPAEIAGARTLLAALARDARVRVAVATGSMRAPALDKLLQLGLDPATVSLATASDCLTREEIVRRAIERATREDAPGGRALALGDGVWDQRAAAHLGIPFLGVESGTHRFAGGAVRSVDDLRDLTPDVLIALAGEHDRRRPLQSATPTEEH